MFVFFLNTFLSHFLFMKNIDVLEKAVFMAYFFFCFFIYIFHYIPVCCIISSF